MSEGIPALPSWRDEVQQLNRQVAYYRGQLDELSGQVIRGDSMVSRSKRELAQRRRALALLSELHREITTDMQRESIFASVVANIEKTLKMNRTVLLAWDGEGQLFYPVAWAGYDQRTAGRFANLHLDCLVEDVCHWLVTKDTPDSAVIAELRGQLGIPFFVAVPILCNGRVEAWLVSGQVKEAKPFFPPLDENDVSTFSSIAGFLTNALENARLFARTQRMAHSFARFVPKQFLEFLGRDSIVDVQPGDQTQQEMTVLFSDIRSFTTISERMTPKQNFDFINLYLRTVAPVIRQHGGFIDKYIGDAIMALFPGTADTAVAAAIGMQHAVREFNHTRDAAQIPPISIGIGLHTGKLMLGTIGSDERLEGTVISDAVNLASRMEGLTKTFGAEILVSGATFGRLENPGQFAYRMVDCVQVKGKTEPVQVIEILLNEKMPDLNDSTI